MSVLKPIAVNASKQRQIVKQEYIDSVVNKPSERCAEHTKLSELPDVTVLESTTTIAERISPSIVEVLDDIEMEFSPVELARCFDALENYALNLIDFPWKKEFHTILLYCGFYKACLEPYLHHPQRLFQLIGYERVANDRLFLVRGIPDRNHLINCAFDFFLAALECHTIERIVSKLPRVSEREVYLFRRYEAGTEQSCITRIVASSRDVKPHRLETYNRNSNETRRDSLYDNIEMFELTDSSSSFSFQSRSPAVDKKLLIDASLTDDRSAVQSLLPFRQSGVSQQVGQSSQSRECLSRGVQWPTGSCAGKNSPQSRVASSSAAAAVVGVDEVDALVALLKDIDPSSMAEPLTRKQILTQIGERSSSLEHRSLEADHATTTTTTATTMSTTSSSTSSTATLSGRRLHTEPRTRHQTQTMPKQSLQQSVSTSDKFTARPTAAAAVGGSGSGSGGSDVMRSSVSERPHTEPLQQPRRSQTTFHTAPVRSVRSPADTTTTTTTTTAAAVGGESSQTVDRTVGWQCKLCTFYNALGSKCEICQNPK